MANTKSVLTTYYTLTLLTTLSASFIWGVNTLFLLDAGLTNTQAFAANAFYTLGMMLFEVPTGVVADTRGRRLSFLIGTITLLLSTLLYLWLWKYQSPFILWALASMILGLGFTFFSGAVEAWIVDALKAVNYAGSLDSVFARNQMVNGFAMLSGSVAGGVIAQYTDLGMPYIVRAVLLILTFVFAFFAMKDLGFNSSSGSGAVNEMRRILRESLEHGWRQPTVQKLMLASPFTMGVLLYSFYAMQPYLLELYGDSQAYSVAGLAAAIVAGAQMLGGLLVPKLLTLFDRRTSILLLGSILSSILLLLIGLSNGFYIAIGLLICWAMILTATMPIRQSLMNSLIPSEQRATVLSFDSLMSSSGGVIWQPTLGKSADVWSYSLSYMISAIIQLIALPFIVSSRRSCSKEDKIDH